MRHFRTVSAIRAATQLELAGIVGQSKARRLREYFDADADI